MNQCDEQRTVALSTSPRLPPLVTSKPGMGLPTEGNKCWIVQGNKRYPPKAHLFGQTAPIWPLMQTFGVSICVWCTTVRVNKRGEGVNTNLHQTTSHLIKQFVGANKHSLSNIIGTCTVFGHGSARGWFGVGLGFAQFSVG